MGEPDADFDKLVAEQGELQDKIDAANAWDLDRTLEIAMDALRLPPATPTSRRCRAVSAAGSRSAACSSANPICCSSTSRRTISTPNRWRGSSTSSRSTRAPSSRSRTIGTSSTTSRAGSSSSIAATGIPWEGQLLVVARAEAGAPRARGEGRRRPVAATLARARMGTHVATRPPGEGQGPADRIQALLAEAARPSAVRQAAVLGPTPDRGSATSSSRPNT